MSLAELELNVLPFVVVSCGGIVIPTNIFGCCLWADHSGHCEIPDIKTPLRDLHLTGSLFCTNSRHRYHHTESLKNIAVGQITIQTFHQQSQNTQRAYNVTVLNCGSGHENCRMPIQSSARIHCDFCPTSSVYHRLVVGLSWSPLQVSETRLFTALITLVNGEMSHHCVKSRDIFVIAPLLSAHIKIIITAITAIMTINKVEKGTAVCAHMR